MKIIGASIIGHSCERFIWFANKNIPEVIDEKTKEIFAKGKELEEQIITKMRESGVNVINTDANGKQFWYHHPETNLIGGFVDGIVEENGERYVIEIKSANDKNFKKFQKYGVINSNPQYLSQLNCYIKWGNFSKGKWIVINKETDEIYTEELQLNEDLYEKDMKKVWRVLKYDIPNKTPSFITCKYCQYKLYCDGKLPEPNCRLCSHAHMIYDVTDEYIICCSKGNFGELCDKFEFERSLCLNAGFVPIENSNDFTDDYGQIISLTGLENCINISEAMRKGYSPKC